MNASIDLEAGLPVLNRPALTYRLRTGVSRRGFLTSMLAAGAGSACTGSDPLDALAGRAPDNGAEPFPPSTPLYVEDFENWTREIRATALRTFAPRTPEDVVAAANWAARNGHALRPRGMRHNWSPLAIDFTTTADTPLILADTTQFLNRVEMVTGSPTPAVRVETGMLMEDLLGFLEEHGHGFTAVPAVGQITLGGALAINAHGCAVPATGEPPLPNQTYGSLSNRVLSMTAVAWDEARQRYALRVFDRTEPEIGALLTHLGRAFITEVTLAVEPNQNLRCVSYVDIPASELFAPPGSGGRDIASFLDSGGRIESIWYAFTDNPWLKVWSVAPEKPLLSREVTGPYNYPFSDNIPDEVARLAQQLVTGNPESAPAFGQTTYAVTVAGLTATASFDLWGPSKNTMMFIKPTTLRVHECSYTVLTRRANVQQVISDFTGEYLRRRDAYRAQGRYPVNMPIEYRVTGLDRAADVGLSGAQTARLSAIAPHPDRPEWDTAVWLSILTLPGTPDMFAFFREMEQWLHEHFRGESAGLRPEWSKGWAYTDVAGWSDAAMIGHTIPDLLRAGHGADSDWDRALGLLAALDPQGLFRNGFLDRLHGA